MMIKNDYFQCEICHKWYKIFHYSTHMELTDDPMHKQKDKKCLMCNNKVKDTKFCSEYCMKKKKSLDGPEI